MSDDAVIRMYLGKRIESARMANESLVLVFDDGTAIRFLDEGGQCCEVRYMTCDDNLRDFTGDRLLGWEVLDAPERDGSGDVHEVQFLHVRTSGGTITCETHNEHNGFYGGFEVRVRELDSEGKVIYPPPPPRPERPSGPPTSVDTTMMMPASTHHCPPSTPVMTT